MSIQPGSMIHSASLTHSHLISTVLIFLSSPNRYTLWTAQENFLVGYPITITAYSDALDVDLYLPDKETKIDAASNNDGVFTFELTAEQAVYGRYELRTVGSESRIEVFLCYQPG